MPYSGADDPNLPENVKKMPAKKRRQWVDIFNSVYASCIKDGGTNKTCEPSAFAQANGVLKKEESRMPNILEKIIYKLAGKTPSATRSTSIGSIFEQIWNIAVEKDPMAFVNDLIVEDDGTIAAIISSGGKLFKTRVTITDGTPSLGDWVEVKIDYPAVTQTRTTITRQVDGKVRWLSVSSSAVLNRSGQIDSRKLFDSFVAHIETTGEYPVRRFCHCYSDEFITGQCDFVARDDNLLITSGLYNDTDLAKIEIAAREADPDYWGESIGFQPEEAQMVELAEGVNIPVFDAGVLLETSTVPEKYAAAWFTNTTQFTEEVQNMLEARAKEALIKLFNGDEDAANKWLAENVDEKNRMIESLGMITRTTEAGDNDTTPTTEPPVAEPPAAEPPAEIVEQEISAEPPAEVPVMEIDEATMDLIAAKVIERQAASDTDLQSLKDTVAALEARVKALEDKDTAPAKETPPAQTEMVVNALKEINQRIKALELDEDEKKKIWLEDAPPKPTVRITHRPRSEEPETEIPKLDTFADVASETLAKLPF